jgi:hypothetical protein
MVAPVPGRECGACMMCCKLPAIPAVEKPSGKWCRYAQPGRGCGSYASRPGVCREFYCAWMINASLGPEWKPDKAKFFIQSKSAMEVEVLVDPGSPGAWKEPRFYQEIKPLAARLFERGGLLTVHVGSRVTMVLPDRDIDAGVVPDNHQGRLVSSVENGRTVLKIVVSPMKPREP